MSDKKFLPFVPVIVSTLLLFLPLAGSPARASTPVKVGAQVLTEHNFAELAGKRIGLITNRSALVAGRHVVQLMQANHNVTLAAIFAPEHGYRGLKEDGATVGFRVDEQTGIPVYSLYGTTRKPTAEMLRGLDALVFDIQGVGARFYTFISTMGLAMQAAAEAHVPFVVLDRPNPLGGEYVSGPVLEEAQLSFTGAYPIPISYGMTVGELALMIKGEQLLPGLTGLELRVIRMKGWRRSMLWRETGLNWVRTSPNIPDSLTALLYPGLCLFEGTAASIGRGTTEPFKLVGMPGIDAERFAALLNNKQLPGVRFEPTRFTPQSIPGMSSHPLYQDRELSGVRLVISDPQTFRSIETGVQVLSALYGLLGAEAREHFFRPGGFDHLAGTAALRKAVEAGVPPERIIADWHDQTERFLEERQAYLLY